MFTRFVQGLFILLYGCTFSTQAFAQLDQKSCEAIFSHLDSASKYSLSIISDVVGTDSSLKILSSSSKAVTVIECEESFLILEDSRNVWKAFIPYDRIKYIELSKKNAWSNTPTILIEIYLIN